MRLVLLFLLLFVSLEADRIIKVASYNVDNLFDLVKNGSEYEEYIPYTASQWSEKTYATKLKNLAKVIAEIDADIIALQEVESLKALKDLRSAIKQAGVYYEHYFIADRKDTTIKVALLSKLKPTYTKELFVTHTRKYRNILEVKFSFKNDSLYLFVNHWNSKYNAESSRIISAKSLKERIKEIGEDKNIIILGDLNSHYEEHIKFTRDRKLNDTYGKTAINHTLNTTEQTTKASQTSYKKGSLYNLWYDTKEDERYSYIYRGNKEVLDNIIISQSLLDKKYIYYIDGTMSSFKKPYLFKGKALNRWQISYGKVRVHKNSGYSDHLPIEAKFMIKEY